MNRNIDDKRLNSKIGSMQKKLTLMIKKSSGEIVNVLDMKSHFLPK